MATSRFSIRPIGQQDKEALEQKVTAQLMLWDAALKRREFGRIKEEDRAQSKTLRQKMDSTWQKLLHLQSINYHHSPHLHERAATLAAELEQSLSGLRQAMA